MYHFKPLQSLHASVPFSLKKKFIRLKPPSKAGPLVTGSVYNGALASLLPFFFLLSIRLVKYMSFTPIS